MIRPRAVDRVLARLKSTRLDRELVAGRPPEASRLHAARADRLVSASFRAELADNWEHVLQVATGRTSPGHGRFVLRYERIIEAEPQIRELVNLLRAPLAGPACGVAAASLLLSDGTGPLYSPLPANKAVLSDAVGSVVSMLDPARQ